jgi:hypothetical protein
MSKSSSPTATAKHVLIKGYVGPTETLPHSLNRNSISCRELETEMVGNRTEPEQWLTFIGSLPSAYYSTNDPASFKQFLSRCDVLIASLPSTPKTQYLLTADHLSESPMLADPRRSLSIS